jgi:hypothetical protein
MDGSEFTVGVINLGGVVTALSTLEVVFDDVAARKPHLMVAKHFVYLFLPRDDSTFDQQKVADFFLTLMPCPSLDPEISLLPYGANANGLCYDGLVVT